MKSDLRYATTALFLFFWLSAPGHAQVACPDPPNRVTVTVNATVTFDPATQLHTYQYEVFNDPTSMQGVEVFAMDFAPPTSEITSPLGWTDSLFDGRSTIDWYAFEIDPSTPDEPDTGDIPPPLFPISPGTSKSGFSFKSPNPPGPVNFYVTGFTQLPGGLGEEGAETVVEECPQIRGNFFALAVSGVTQGPVAGPNTPSLIASPTSIVAGGTLTATWKGIVTPTATDWIGLYVQGAPDTAYINAIYVSCSPVPDIPRSSGSCPFVLPTTLTPDTHELRLFSQDSFTRLATSNSFRVVPTAASLTVSPVSIAAGGTITAGWSGIATPTATDRIGLDAPGGSVPFAEDLTVTKAVTKTGADSAVLASGYTAGTAS